MIGALKPYPEYKESGLPWLGRIPKHWRVLRGKSLFRPTDIRSLTGQEELLTVSSKHGVIPRRTTTVTMFQAASYVGYKLCWPEDLVINSLWAWARGLGVSRYHGIVSSAYGVYRLKGNLTSAGFIDYLVRSEPFQWELQVRSKGIWISRLQLTDEEFLRAPFPIPPPEEQSAAVSFLDWANGRLERAIRVKRELIALLNEQKQAIIHRAVTRGLDPDVPMKPSGVPGLGEIPRDWEARRLRTLVRRVDQGVSPQAEAYLAEGDSWGVLKAGCVNRGVFREKEHKRLASGFPIDPKIVVRLGDILISRACGSPSLVGSAGKVESLSYRLILSDKTFRPVFKDFVDIDFCVFAMNSRYYRAQVEQAISGAEGLANNLPLSSLRGFHFAIPPVVEARRISAWLRRELGQCSAAVARLEHETELLRDYRTRLVSDVVTGKLDVRGAEVPSDEIIEDTGPLLDAEEVESDEAELVEEAANAD